MDIFGIIIDIISSIGATAIELIGQFLSDPFAVISGVVEAILGLLF